MDVETLLFFISSVSKFQLLVNHRVLDFLQRCPSRIITTKDALPKIGDFIFKQVEELPKNIEDLSVVAPSPLTEDDRDPDARDCYLPYLRALLWYQQAIWKQAYNVMSDSNYITSCKASKSKMVRAFLFDTIADLNSGRLKF
jgi:hypothetical protein